MWYIYGVIPGYYLYKGLGYLWQYLGTNRYEVLFIIKKSENDEDDKKTKKNKESK